MKLKINLEIIEGKIVSELKGPADDLMALLAIAMCKILHQNNEEGRSNCEMACGVAAAVRGMLDKMDQDYKEATPEKPLMKELPGRMIYVDACPTLLAALARAAQLGKENGVQFRMAADVRTQAASARAKRGAKSRWKK